MANEVYQVIGTPITFKSSGGSVVWTPAGTTTLQGRKSASWDRGESPQPEEYSWRAKIAWQNTPVVGEAIDFYIATSDGTIIDGTTTAGDATFTDTDALPNMLYVGSLIADMTTTDSVQGSGVFRMYERYGVLVMVNNGTETLSATDGDHEFIATPIYSQGQ